MTGSGSAAQSDSARTSRGSTGTTPRRGVAGPVSRRRLKVGTGSVRWPTSLSSRSTHSLQGIPACGSGMELPPHPLRWAVVQYWLQRISNVAYRMTHNCSHRRELPHVIWRWASSAKANRQLLSRSGLTANPDCSGLIWNSACQASDSGSSVLANRLRGPKRLVGLDQTTSSRSVPLAC